MWILVRKSLTGHRSIKEQLEQFCIYWRSGLYKYWERVFGADWLGFRLVFVVLSKFGPSMVISSTEIRSCVEGVKNCFGVSSVVSQKKLIIILQVRGRVPASGLKHDYESYSG